MSLTLAYSNEDDRAYGLAGMTVSLAANRAIDRVVEISIDAEGPMVTFGHEYYFTGSPSISPKASWDNMVQNFAITSSMIIANAMARAVVRMHEDLSKEIMDDIRSRMYEDGAENCALEADEVDAIFTRAVAHNRRLFYNPRLHAPIDELARTISRRRRLSGLEIIDELRLLQLL